MTTEQARNVQKPFLFEVSTEVANKVGGIYTVLKTKVPVTAAEYGDRYCLLGPLSHKFSSMEVEQCEPKTGPMRQAIHALTSRGIRVLFGKWLIESSPYVLLFDLGSAFSRLNEWKADLWSQCELPTPDSDFEMNDAVVFGYLVSWFIGEFANMNRKNAIIAHFHEWMASVALVLIRKRNIDVTTIFTTHATLLGRYLCAGSVDFYNSLHRFDVDYEAGKRGIYHRYCLERAAAHSSHVFTTVSHITAYEAEHLLKRKPDGVLPNGLNVVKFSAMHEFQNLHAQYKNKIHEFVRGHFYGHYNFELENTLYFFTAGRYEFRNKGVDMFLEALARVNHRLKHLNSPITVVAFIIMPAATHSFTVDTLKGQAVMKQLRDIVDGVQESIGKRIFDSCSRGKLPDVEELLTEEETVLLKRRIYALKRDSLPPVVTHNMEDDANDPILEQIRRLHLHNNDDDRVKIVFHPEFLSNSNPLFGMDYDDFVRGCHLGVFPSYYEPWGYTPAECTVMGVPSITTNLSGFGCFMEENIDNPSDYGIYIVDRRMKSVEESIQQLADTMVSFTQKSRRQRINQRNRTERLSDILDWKTMGLEYVKARQLALMRKYPLAFKGEHCEYFESTEDEAYEGSGVHHSGHDDDEEESELSTPKETESAEVNDHLEEGRKIRKPFSAPSSPKMRALMEETQDGMLDLKSIDHVKVAEKLEALETYHQTSGALKAGQITREDASKQSSLFKRNEKIQEENRRRVSLGMEPTYKKYNNSEAMRVSHRRWNLKRKGLDTDLPSVPLVDSLIEQKAAVSAFIDSNQRLSDVLKLKNVVSLDTGSGTSPWWKAEHLGKDEVDADAMDSDLDDEYLREPDGPDSDDFVLPSNVPGIHTAHSL